MSQAPSVAFARLDEATVASAVVSPPELPAPPAAARDRPAPRCDLTTLRGTTRGLEILVHGAPSIGELEAQLTELLAEAPGFFAGSQARVAVAGALPAGALGAIEQIAARFEVQIAEIGPVAAKRRSRDVPAVLRPIDAPRAGMAEGTGPIAERPPAAVAPAGAALPAAAPLAVAPPGPRLVIGPVRSGVIVDHPGHVIVLGDVNPCAEVRAEGSIIVLGRLRGVAHAAIGRAAGCIIALSLQPQQLRIGRMVARAADADRPSAGAEIAYATGETIVVERFSGRLPSGLAASM